MVSTLSEIDAALIVQKGNMLPGVYEELSFSVRHAKTNILAWKAHILRSINQDSSRIDILEMLDESSVLVIQDWAMKYLPRKYRESQTDWFGKRGIPWHISVAFRKISDQFQMLTFAHIFQTCSQDSCAVLAVVVDVIKQLKNIIPGLKKVSFRQDNAGCYHCGTTIVCASTLGAELGVTIKRLDFSDPQGGKGACDHKEASIKSHMHIYLNSGHDIETPEQMTDAIRSSGGVPSLSVTLCDSITSPSMDSHKIDEVSLLSNIEFTEEGIRVWRAYGVGTGKLISQIPEASLSNRLPSLVVRQAHPSSFSSGVKRRAHGAHPSGIRSTDDKTETEEEHSASRGALFTSPEEGCTQTFLRHSSMMQHLDCGTHKRALENETLFDKAAQLYAEQLEGQAMVVPVVSTVSRRAGHTDSQPMGYALKPRATRRTRFTANQKSNLTTKFKLGEQTGSKADPAAVARSMMCAKDATGDRLFSSDEFLPATQIAGFFSRLASKKTLENDDQEDEEVAAHENNLCEMVSQNKVNEFCSTVLKDICTSLGIDTAGMTVRRKKPYIDKIQSLCQECACQQ